jgi:UDP-glucose 4-epimerase
VRIAVTGTSGLIGGAVAARVGVNHTIVTLGRREGLDIHVDFSDPASVQGIDLSGCDALVHCAGVVDEDFKDNPSAAFLHATVSIEALIDRAVAAGVSKIAYFSTAHVYGAMEGTISDNSPTNPISNYGIAHMASELILRRAAVSHGIDALALRPNAVFGVPDNLDGFDRWWLIPYSFPISAVREGVIELRSAGAARRNFVSANDLAGYVERFLNDDTPSQGFTAINSVGPDSSSIREFADACALACRETLESNCAVVAPLAVGCEPGSDFEYITKTSSFDPKDRIQNFIEQFVTLVAKYPHLEIKS